MYVSNESPLVLW